LGEISHRADRKNAEKKEKKFECEPYKGLFFFGKNARNTLYFEDFEGKKEVQSRHI
jgi:hypothetical protein